MASASELLHESNKVLASSRVAARLARTRLHASRKRLSQTEDTIVSSAATVSAARWLLVGDKDLPAAAKAR